jgi:hypothetical protein
MIYQYTDAKKLAFFAARYSQKSHKGANVECFFTVDKLNKSGRLDL